MHSVLQLPFCAGPHSQLSWGVQAADWTKLLVFAFTLLDTIRDEDYSRLLWFPSKENQQRLLEKSIGKTQVRSGAKRGKAPPWRLLKKAGCGRSQLYPPGWDSCLSLKPASLNYRWEGERGGREGEREGREGRDRRQGTETRREGVPCHLSHHGVTEQTPWDPAPTPGLNRKE